MLTTARFSREEEGYSLLLYYSVLLFLRGWLDTTIANGTSTRSQKFQGFPQLLRAIPAKLLNRLNDLFPEEPPLRFLPELTRTRKRACNHNWKIICAAIEDETACSNTSAEFFRLVSYCRVIDYCLPINYFYLSFRNKKGGRPRLFETLATIRVVVRASARGRNDLIPRDWQTSRDHTRDHP